MKIILLHGWGQDKSVWKNLVDKLGRNSLCFDMPGFGKEKIVDSTWGVPEYTQWVIDKIKNYDDVILIGHSFGGRITVEIASKNPKWLRGIILSGAPCVYKPSLKTKLKIAVFKIAKFLIPYNLRLRYFPRDLKNAIDRGLETTFRKVINYDQTNQLQKINIPSLLIWGQNDLSVPLNVANEINKSIKNSKLKIINNADHNSFLDNPNLFYGYVKKFIESI